MGESIGIADTQSKLQEALEQGRTLPATWYTDPVLYSRERDQIFRRTWQYVGLTEQLASPGDFFTATVGEVPIVVVKGKDEQIRAFANVCRHRGAIVVREQQGHRTSLQCHYHAWTYDLDGTLRSAPSMKDEASFDTACYRLPTLGCETWGPFIFVNPDPRPAQAQPLSDFLGELPALVTETGLDLTTIRRRVRRTYDIAANWKVVLDNYLECYHCPVAHPGFCDLIDTNEYVITEYEHFSTQQGALKSSARQGKDAPYQIGAGVENGFYAFLWPNFTLNIYPGPGNVSLNLFLPLGSERTIAIYDYCFADAISAQEEQAFVRFIDQVQEEDIVLCESVQRGLTSGYLEQGQLMLSKEKALRHFQKLVYRYVTLEPSPVR
jgi:phenylpropionate dioxygenase-like ring-hydroxylating dioxygenase large terminal subunit